MDHDAHREVFVGIDGGTTGATVTLFDRHGAELGSGYSEYACHYPHPGWVEQDVEEVWQGICAASRTARAAAAEVPDAAIRSLGLSSQRGTFVLLDDRRQPLTPSVVWNDSRAKAEEEVLAANIDRDRFRRITGCPLTASWAVVKLLWLLRNRPGLMERTRHICNGQEYFLHRLGAERLETDPSSLTLNGMLDIRQLSWSEEVCRAAGIDPTLLPPVGSPGTMVGRLSAAAAAMTGLPAGIPLCRGGGDQQCAAVGSGVIRQGLAEVTVGTSAMMVAHLDDIDLVTGHAPYIGGHAIAGKWDLEGGAFSIGSCLRWWRDNFAAAEREAARRQGKSAYDLMLACAEEVPAGSRGLVFHPFFAGQVTPYYDSTARGGFHGLSFHHDKACMVRSILEGCACEIRFMVDGIAHDLTGGIQELRMTGGATRSNLFMQIVADLLRRPVALLRSGEATVLGAAILGAVGAGYFSGIEEAVGEMVTIARVLEPEAANKDIYEDLFGLFRQGYECSARSGFYDAMYAFQHRYF